MFLIISMNNLLGYSVQNSNLLILELNDIRKDACE